MNINKIKFIFFYLFFSSLFVCAEEAAQLPSIEDFKFSASFYDFAKFTKRDISLSIEKKSSQVSWASTNQKDEKKFQQIALKIKAIIPREFTKIELDEQELDLSIDGSFVFETVLDDRSTSIKFKCYYDKQNYVMLELKITLAPQLTILQVHKSCSKYKFRLEDFDDIQKSFIQIRCEDAPMKDKQYFRCV